MATPVLAPTATRVRIEIATKNGKRVAIAWLDPVPISKKEHEEMTWDGTGLTSNVTIEFPNGSPFVNQGPFLVRCGELVNSGPVAANTPFCKQCPAEPKPHKEGHYKYVIRDAKTKEILADPEVIIRN